jgi:serine protease
MLRLAFGHFRERYAAVGDAGVRATSCRIGSLGVAVRRFAWVILLAATAAAIAATVSDVERNPVRRHPHAGAPATGTQHILIKLRGAPGGPPAVPASADERVAGLAQRAGLALDGYRSITADVHVLHVASPAAGTSVAETLARLRADPHVQYAELDQRRFIHTVPNDTLYPQQWYLMPSSATTPAALDAQTAWSTTTGPQGLVIADIDTGVRFDHPDLLAVSQPGGRLLPGYCFISDAFTANNTSCPGTDASDPGDWVSSADLNQTACKSAGVTQTSVSSWHGTRVAGMLGAIANNMLGIAGITWNTQILPVRALGVCGGSDSDILSGMLWAAGVAVSGVPSNPHPAKIINLSLGATGPCPASWQDTINQLTALGVLIIVSAGNEGGEVDAPGNCTGVAAVAGLRHAGTKVGFSNVGPDVAVGAPAGNCVNTGANQPCLYSLITTTNLGSQGPDANDYTGEYYCDGSPSSPGNANCVITGTQYRSYNLGTSFAAPQVAGIGALMLAVNTRLNSCQLIARLKEGALPYPQTSVGATTQPPMCHVPANATDLQQAECICTRDGQTCGAGMANASGALTAALRPIAAVAVSGTLSAGQIVQLKATGSAAAGTHTINAYAWSNTGGQSLAIQNANTDTASVTLPSCGLSTVALTVTDDAGRQDTAQMVVSPTAVTTTAPAQAGQAACSVAAPAVQVEVCPATVSVQTNATQTFVATVVNTTNTSVSWQVNGTPGGNATVGTISSSGVYTAPANVPAVEVTVSAVSAADNTVQSTAQLSVTAPPGTGGGGGALDWLTLLLGAAALVGRGRRATAGGVRP